MKRIITTSVLVSLLACNLGFGRSLPDPVEPNYIKGEKLARPGLNYAALGPTGAHGYIWAERMAKPTPTTKTRMILIKRVEKGTPADGVLQVGDVILGIGDKRFASDARMVLSAAITEAEKNENGGKLVLNIWRPSAVLPATQENARVASKTGAEQQVEITLPVMGSYSKTSPRDCEKTEKIINAACTVIVKRGIENAGNQVAGCIDALGLLATGDKSYWPLVRTYITHLEEQSKSDKFESLWTWHVAYSCVLVCEYYLLSGDKSVLPIIARYSNRIALGRSGVGTWSHGFADPAQNDGKPFGMPAGYGAMNQIGLTCALSLALAQKCGINSEEIDVALKKSSDFMTFYVDKGTIPYGDHDPNTKGHENNGANSQAAVLFDILGDKKAATYFTRMTLASYQERESGHTGHFFNWNWGALGAGRAGGEAASSFIDNTRWYSELERRADGASIYQPQLANVDHDKYTDWSTTGSRLLQHCLPRKQLYITGKGGGVVDPIAGEELKKVVQAELLTPGENDSVDTLLTLLGHWSPRVRYRAAVELNKREDDVVEKLIAMLDSKNEYARYGACAGIKFAGCGSEKALHALIKKGLYADSTTMRYHAINAFMINPRWNSKNPGQNQGIKVDRTMSAVAHLALPDLAKVALKHYPEEARAWTQTYAGYALFGNYCLRDREPAGEGLMKTNMEAWKALDIKTRVKVVENLLHSEFGNVRASVGQCYRYLCEQELALLMPAILEAVEYPAPSGVMFGPVVRFEGLKILADHHIKEGMEAGVKLTVRTPGWGGYARKVKGLPELAKYGAALEDFLPEIEENLMRDIKGRKAKDDFWRVLTSSLDKMKTAPAPKLMTVKEFQQSIKTSE